MKQNQKTLLFLAILLCIVGAVCAVLAVSGGKEDPSAETTGQTLTIIKETPTEDISAFTLYGQSGTFSFERGNAGWLYNADVNFPLSDDFVNGALTTLSCVDAVRVLESDGQTSPYGLDRPQMKVSVTAKDGEHTYLIGDYNSFNGYHYMMEEGQRTVYLIDTDLVDLCTSTEADMIVLGSLPENYAEGTVNAVTVSGTEYTSDHGEFEALQGELAAMTVTDYADYYAEQGEYTDTVPVNVEYSVEKTTAKDDGSEVSATVADEYTFTVVGMDDTYLLFMIEDSSIVYRMKKEDLPTLCSLL